MQPGAEVIRLDDVVAAAERLRGVAHRTPVLTSRTLDGLTGAKLFLKAENLQRGGAFKLRGAYNRISTLDADQVRAGVGAYSSGNHAQAVAIAAKLVGARALIVMPEDAPATKLAATRGYGAEVILYDRYGEDRAELGRRLVQERGLTLVAPYDDPMVMAGQGTLVPELLEEAGDLDLLIVPVGGGGLIAGCGTAAKALRPGIHLVGVEPKNGDDTRRSLEAGDRIALPAVPETIADGLQSEVPGELTFEVNRRLVDEVVTVSDDQIVDAMRFCFERLKTVVEPSGATAIAAALSGRVEAAGRRVGCVLSGGNVGADLFRELLDRSRDGGAGSPPTG